MFLKLHDHSKGLKGSINIGIPPLILSVVFSEVMPKLILENPGIQFNLKEIGAYQLKMNYSWEMLTSQSCYPQQASLIIWLRLMKSRDQNYLYACLHAIV